MATPNVPLQKRAGLNIGIEPGAAPFLQYSGGREVEINPAIGAKTVILECPEGIARTPLTQVAEAAGGAGGVIVNTTTNTFAYEVWFRDADGNEAKIADVFSLAGPGFDAFVANNSYLDETAFTLTPGEKIFILSVPAPR